MRASNRPPLSCGKTFQCILWMCGVISPIFAQPAVSGRVTAEDNLGLPRALVILQNLNDPSTVLQTNADRQGRYEFGEVSDGKYSLEVSYPGFVGNRLSPIRVQFPLRVQKNFVLAVAPGDEGGVQVQAEIVGELKQAGRRLEHAKLCLQGENTERCTVTNGIGQYYLSIQPGAYDVVVSLEGNMLWKSRIVLPRVGPYRNKIQADGQPQK